MIALSMLAHSVLVGASLSSGKARAHAPRPALARSAHLAERVPALVLPVAVTADRRALMAEARRARAEGRLALGDFLLRANAIDAAEAGKKLDLTRARDLYTGRLSRLRDAAGEDPKQAVPGVLGDLHYYGRPGGSMGEALLQGGGSCEPLSHLIAATLYDAGYRRQAKLRFYGGEGDGGATHLAPIYAEGGREHDLLTGTPARTGGSMFGAEDLVEAYARAHGLAPPIEAPPIGGSDQAGGHGASEGSAEDAVPLPTMASGYPPNRDRFPGTTPLYADRAVQAPEAPTTSAAPPAVDASDCAFFVRVAVLDPPSLAITDEHEAFGVELRRIPSGAQLDRIFGLVQAVERSTKEAGSKADPVDRIMGLACLTALYDQAAVGFELKGERPLAQLASERGHRAAKDGEALLASLDLDTPAGARFVTKLADHYAGRSWLLLLLRGGDSVILRIGGDVHRNDWGRTSALSALLIAPSTRRAALGIVEGLRERQKIAVMHEVFHAHDHQRPWASNYALDDAGDSEFARVYRVFRGVAWGLWESARPTEEVLATMLHEAEREHVDRAWVSAILDYYGRNALALHLHRADGPVFAGTLKRWLRRNGYADLDLYQTELADAAEPT
ncbi:Hypothetical protein A7982_07132 [Minicystis rosea]|nr:Hypothetical protein A7982_07132 [Minicystis rosea]